MNFGAVEDFIMNALQRCIVLIVGAAIFIGIPYLLYSWATYKPPETFELRVDGWKCTDGYNQDTRVCAKGCYWRHEYICTKWEAK